MNKNISILYVEDDVLTVEAFLDAFSDIFKKVHVAYNATDGLELFLKEKPDIVLTDLQMPQVSGLELISNIRETNQTIPIIVNSAFNNTKFLLESINLHVNEYTMKPTDPYKLLSIFEKISETLLLQKSVKNSQNMLQTIINEMPDPIIYIKSDLSVAMLNTAAKRFNQEVAAKEIFTCHELIFKNMQSCTNETFVCPIKTIKKTREPLTLYNLKAIIDEEERCFDIHIRPIFDEENEINGYIEVMHDMTEYIKIHSQLVDEKEKLEHISMHDQLTHLPNRRLLNDRMEQVIKHKSRTKETFGVFFIDLDHFKEINDSLGHLAGDILLVEFSKRMHNSIREQDTLARIGGDEFVLIVENSNDLKHYEHFAEKIAEILREPFIINEKNIYSSCSIGISVFPQDGKTAEKLISNADAAMYFSKRSGRHNFTFYSQEMTKEASAYINIASDLVKAIAEDEFVLYYQPIRNIITDKYTKIEALLRWRHVENELMLPNSFLPIADKAGLLTQVDFWVLESVLKSLETTKLASFGIESISVNLTAETFFSQDFIVKLVNLIEFYNFDATFLVFEIVENQLMQDVVSAKKIVLNLHALGIKVAIDDFGTGYSSLSYLLEFSIDILKIDKSFINNITTDKKAFKLVKSLISLAKILEYEVVAEGVEHESQMSLLQSEEIGYIQGYYFAKPMDYNALMLFLLQ